VLAPYARLLGVPHVGALVATSVLGRLSFATWPLGLVLFVEERTDSFASAGAVSAAGALAAALGSPVTSRLVDRLGPTRVLAACVLVNAPLALALVALGLAGASPLVLAALAVAGGLVVPPVSPALRGLWPRLLRAPEDLRAALALDAILLEGIFILGPLLAAAVLAVGSPAALLVASTAATALGTLGFVAQPPARRAAGSPGGGGPMLGPLAVRGLRTLLVGALAVGTCFGALEVALPAFADAEGVPSLAALAFAAQALGSTAGGLVYGARSAGQDVRRLYLLLLLALPPSLALIALADSVATLLLFAAVSGCVIAPLTAAENELAGQIAPRGTVTEAYGWIIMAVVLGIAAGNASAGVLAEGPGWRAAVLAPCALTVAAAGLVIARSATLRPAGAAAGA
jgi:MFS family permease